MENDKLVRQPPSAAMLKLSAPQREYLASMLVALQDGTRKLSEIELMVWRDTLCKYPMADLETVIREFMATATKDAARGIVLGDLTKPLNILRADRIRQREDAEQHAKLAEWKAEYDAEGPERERWLKEQAEQRAAAMAMDTTNEAQRREQLQAQKVNLLRESK